jgi:ABC-type multidrug transport system fused ATPase/permease subunit
MHDFLHFAKRMLAFRWTLAGAIGASLLAALTLGVGLLAVVPILRNVLGTVNDKGQVVGAKDLPTLARELDATLGGWLPDAWINALPAGRYEALLVTMLALGAVTIVGAVANFLHVYWSQTVASRTLLLIRNQLFAHIVRLPLRTVMRVGPTNAVSQIIADTYQLWGGFISLSSKVMAQLPKGLVALGAAFATDWRLALGALGLGAVLAGIIRKLGTKMRRAGRRGLMANAELLRVASEAVGQLRVVKTNSAEAREGARFDVAATEFFRQEMKVRTARALAGPLVESLSFIGMGAMVLIVGKAIIDRAVDPSSFIATVLSLGVAAACFKPLTALYADMQVSNAAASRLLALEREAPEPGREQHLPALPRHRASIRIEGVGFTYPGADQPALDDINLTIRHGQTVAFVGPNGCGKTTLLSLIPRLFEPDAGRVLVDEADIRAHRVQSLREQIGVVTQEAALFKGTIRWNLTFGVEHAGEQQVQEAVRRARAEDFIGAKPGGLEAELGEGGAGLSGGQRQRLCIARAILRDPAILILDEATSMVDADSERKIADALAEFTRGRTCLIVAHRLSTVVHADLIVVMNAGRIEDVGRHDELLERSPTYRLIAQTQLVGATA